MAPSHKIEFDLEGLFIELKINFNSGSEPEIEYVIIPKMKVKQTERLTLLISKLINFHNTCAAIHNIEITELA